ncbi:YkvA family protein [Paenibacillus sp. YIM B09110]|uniref:YkvA family protein n=1 Tax=Paenibacillus sp. YIM B09110 TaxID=3126102 RepID=UPI00301D3E2B
MTTIECLECGRSNEVDTDKLLTEGCAYCGSKLVEEAVPYEVSTSELEETLHGEATGTVSPSEVDVNKWVGKIGDHDKQVKYVEEGFWAKVKRHAAKVPFAKEVVTLYYCSVDPKTPLSAKVTAIGALAYWIMPIDLIPDFIPVAGFVDDATAVLIAYKAISGQITDEHREKAEQFFVLSKNVKLIDRTAK